MLTTQLPSSARCTSIPPTIRVVLCIKQDGFAPPPAERESRNCQKRLHQRRYILKKINRSFIGYAVHSIMVQWFLSGFAAGSIRILHWT